MDKNFQRHIFEKQMSVLRGQVLNLANALRDGKSPYELVQMRPVRILRCPFTSNLNTYHPIIHLSFKDV